MAKNLTDVDEFTAPVAVPTDGDALAAVTVEVGFQALANRTAYLKTEVERARVVELAIESIAYARLEYDPTTQAASPKQARFGNSGLALYVSDLSTDTIYQYTLTTAYDVTTAVYASKSLDVTSEVTTGLFGFFWKPDGTAIYAGDLSGDVIYQYTVSTPWDLSTASYASKSLDTSTQVSTLVSFQFHPDGDALYALDGVGAAVYKYTLSTAWDVSTGSYATQTLSVSAQETAPEGLSISSDGLCMVISGTGGDDLTEYLLSTAWDVSTGTATGRTFDLTPFVNVSSTFSTVAGPAGRVMLTASTGSGLVQTFYAAHAVRVA